MDHRSYTKYMEAVYIHIWNLYVDHTGLYCSGTKYICMDTIRPRMFVWNSAESRVEEQTVIKLPLTSSPQVSNNIFPTGRPKFLAHSLTHSLV